MPQKNVFAVGNHQYHVGTEGVSLLHPLLAQEIKENAEESAASYYSNKRSYLRQHGILGKQREPTDLELLPMTPELVAEQLANTRQVVFEVTDACNLSCVYCGYGEMYHGYDKRENSRLPVEKAKRLIDYLVEFWESDKNNSPNRHTYFSFYGGEPLLNMPFIETIVSYVEQLKCPTRTFDFGMTTNAVLLKRHMDFLVAHEFNLVISLDGGEENTGYRIDHAKQPAYQRIVDSVDALRAAYPDFFKKNVSFNAVLHNKNSVESIFRFFKDRYEKTPNIGELNQMGIREDMREQFMNTYRNSQESLRQSEHYSEIEKEMFVRTASYQSATTFLHHHSGFVYHSYPQLLYGQDENRRIPTGTCLPFSKKIFLTVNGKLLPCERISQQHALGEVSDTEVMLDLPAIAARYNAYFSKLEKQCKQCQNVSKCMQCIFNLPAINEKKFACHGFTTKDELQSHVAAQIEFFSKHRSEYYRIMNEVVLS